MGERLRWEVKLAYWLAALATAALTAGATQLLNVAIRQAVVEQRLIHVEQSIARLEKTSQEIAQSQRDMMASIHRLTERDY